jgi:hypothetical protein
MKTLLLGLIAAHCVTPYAVAAPVAKLGNFELTDQEANKRIYRFPKTKVTVMTVADQKGADQLAPWIQRVYDRFQNQIDIDGVADVSMIPKLFRPILREGFKKQLGYSVMLDWDIGDAHNLEIIIPPWLQFELLTKGPIEMRPVITEPSAETGSIMRFLAGLW